MWAMGVLHMSKFLTVEDIHYNKDGMFLGGYIRRMPIQDYKELVKKEKFTDIMTDCGVDVV